MAEQIDLTRCAHALGRYWASWRFADGDLRRVFVLYEISKAWDTYRQDAGPGEVGRAHETPVDARGVLHTDDPRRDAVLLWLADHGAPEVAEGARTLARMVTATRRFSADEHGLLHEARDAIDAAQAGPVARRIAAAAPYGLVVASLMTVARAVDELRASAAFVEGTGEDVYLPVPSGTFSHYVPAPPGATWALNLAAFAASSAPARALPLPGLARRSVFRLDAEPQECAAELAETAATALTAAGDAIEHAHAQLARGRAALARLSRNSRAFEAWLLFVALGSLTRVQLTRALGLSRAGGDIQARVLAEAGLVTSAGGGRLTWVGDRSAKTGLDISGDPSDALGVAVVDVDECIAAIDQLLARPSLSSGFHKG